MSNRLNECDFRMEVFLRGNKVRDFVEYKSTQLREEYGLNITELKMIMYLDNCEDENGERHDTLGDIGAFLEANKGYMSQRINGLVERGLVTACPDARDRRYVHYALTDAAEPIATAFMNILIEVKNCLTVGITEDEGKVFMAVINKIVANADQLMTNV